MHQQHRYASAPVTNGQAQVVGEGHHLHSPTVRPAKGPVVAMWTMRLDTLTDHPVRILWRQWSPQWTFRRGVDMSEQGWREFVAAQGGSDWVVLHGGAMAVFRVSSMVEAARLAEALAQVPGLAGSGVLITIADSQLTVRLARGVFRLEERHVQLAQA